MKFLLSFFLFMTISSTNVFSQELRETTDEKLLKFNKQIEIEVSQLKNQLEKSDDYLSEHQKQLSIEFAVDTFRIERLYSLALEIDYSTYGMVNTTLKAESSYDKLLNKYYKMLLNKLSNPDKEILKQSQRNWIIFRDSEKKLIIELAKDEYSGGGTIQSINTTFAYLSLTKSRVLELFGHLLGMIE